jgi:hypothetical protein
MTDEVTMDELINHANALRLQVKNLRAEADALDKSLTKVEGVIMARMDDQGLTTSGTDRATVSISEEVLPQVDPAHWEEVWKHLFENGYTELMRKQLNSTSYRELLALGAEIPFVSPFTKRKLNVRGL